jgi:hypothetical protein
LAVLCRFILNPLLLHESHKDCLIDRVVCKHDESLAQSFAWVHTFDNKYINGRYQGPIAELGLLRERLVLC